MNPKSVDRHKPHCFQNEHGIALTRQCVQAWEQIVGSSPVIMAKNIYMGRLDTQSGTLISPSTFHLNKNAQIPKRIYIYGCGISMHESLDQKSIFSSNKLTLIGMLVLLLYLIWNHSNIRISDIILLAIDVTLFVSHISLVYSLGRYFTTILLCNFSLSELIYFILLISSWYTR